MKKQKMLFGLLAFLLTLSLLAACISDDDLFSPDDLTEWGEDTAEQADDFNAPANTNGVSEKVTKFVNGIIEEDQLPGAAVAIIHGDQITFAQGFGLRDVENDLPVTTDTLFHIGSTNKSITSMMIATLVDQGVLNWDTPVVEIYPDFALSSDESTQEVTIRHLLSMQSGIPDTAEDDFDIDYASAEDVFEYVTSVPLLAAPGEEFSYSNISASLAGYIGVIAKGDNYPNLYTGYEALLRKQVLEPIGMKTAVVRVSQAENNPNYGKSYVLDGNEVVEAEREDVDGDPLAPSGTLKANVMEMAYYISTHLRKGLAPNGVRVVSEENLVETWKPGLENYAMGWEISEYEGMMLISHEGSFDNYLSVIGFVPDLDMGFVILTNSEETGARLVEEGPGFLVDLFIEE